jgi:hypothetical protein
MQQRSSTVLATIGKNAGEEIRIALTEFSGRSLVDLRTYVAFGGVEEKRPTKKGVSVRIDKLSELLAALELVRDEAVRQGFLPETTGQERGKGGAA